MKLRKPLRLTIAMLAAAIFAAPLSTTADTVPAQIPAPVAEQPVTANEQREAPQQQSTAAAQPQNGDIGPQTYSKDETLQAAEKFFGGTTEGLAKAVEKAFGELG